MKCELYSNDVHIATVKGGVTKAIAAAVRWAKKTKPYPVIVKDKHGKAIFEAHFDPLTRNVVRDKALPKRIAEPVKRNILRGRKPTRKGRKMTPAQKRAFVKRMREARGI